MKTIYVAFDGREFSKEDECKLYEKQIASAYEENWSDKVISLDGWETCRGYGYFDVFKIDTEDDVKTFNALYDMHNGSYYKYSSVYGQKLTNDDMGKTIITHFNEDGDFMTVIGTPDLFINNIKEHITEYTGYIFEKRGRR